MAEGTRIRLSCLLAGNVYECIRDLRALHLPPPAIICASEIEDSLHRRDKISSPKSRTICQGIHVSRVEKKKKIAQFNGRNNEENKVKTQVTHLINITCRRKINGRFNY